VRVVLRNIAFYLTPKNEVVFEYKDASLRQIIEKMEHHNHSQIPILDAAGKYVSSISEGDILDKLLTMDPISKREAEKIKICQIECKNTIDPVLITADFSDLFLLIIEQNFVPVVDDQGIFIGIITRRDILSSLSPLVEASGDY
jgi:predicted transcriptional regulator